MPMGQNGTEEAPVRLVISVHSRCNRQKHSLPVKGGFYYAEPLNMQPKLPRLSTVDAHMPWAADLRMKRWKIKWVETSVSVSSLQHSH